jgi:hypothetical protein
MAVALEEIVRAERWGAEDLARLLVEISPDRSTPSALDVAATTSAIPRRKRMGRRGALVAATMMLAGAATGATWWLRQPAKPQPTPVPPVHPAPAPAPAGELAAPALPSPSVTVHVDSEPPGAEVSVDGEARPRGRTPLSLALPRSNDQRRLSLTAPGHLVASLDLIPNSDGELRVKLKPSPGRPGPARSNGKQARPRNDLADPFLRR